MVPHRIVFVLVAIAFSGLFWKVSRSTLAVLLSTNP
jgi:hypothetical protein